MSSVEVLNYYEVLGVPKTAAVAEIRKAYKSLALKHHPDKDSASPTHQATANFQQIQKAYEVLSSVQKRFLYDAGSGKLASHEANKARNESALQKAAAEQELRRSVTRDRLVEACKIGDTGQAMKLLRGASPDDLNTVDESGRTPLMYAAEGQRAQIVSLLLLYHGDANIANPEGWTPLSFLLASMGLPSKSEAERGMPCLLPLLKAGANVKAQTKVGLTPLTWACASGYLPMVQSLLEHAAEVDVENGSDMPPLVLAADSGYAEVVGALLRAKASVDIHDSAGRTPLISASALGHEDVVAMLLAAGADPCIKSNDGRNALLHAIEHFGNLCLSCPSDLSKKERGLAVMRLLLAARADLHSAAEDTRLSLQQLTAMVDDSDFLVMMSELEKCSISDAPTRAAGA